MAIADHLLDIDFRTKAERQKNALDDFVSWYEELHEYQNNHEYNDKIQAQISILTGVLWYLMPEKDYRKLTKLKP